MSEGRFCPTVLSFTFPWLVLRTLAIRPMQQAIKQALLFVFEMRPHLGQTGHKHTVSEDAAELCPLASIS